jgi:UDP-N-acetylglucosamine/UDP-N-acetylgalactosamine diphosphorylase
MSQLDTLLKNAGQQHLTTALQSLPQAQQAAFAARLQQIDWQEMRSIARQSVDQPRVITKEERTKRQTELTAIGDAAYKAGKVGALMVAGGMGTRLGYNGPKGCFPVGYSRKTIYQLQAEKVLALSQRLGIAVPFLIMTSPATDTETRAFFAAKNNFGLKAEQIHYFQQGTVPSLSMDGKALLEAPGKLLENPDGHGGCFQALVDSGLLAKIRSQGVEHLVHMQVDNLLTPADDPILIGTQITEKTDIVTKVLTKAHPDEKLGHLVTIDGRDSIVEYTEVTPEQCRELAPDGKPVYRWGSPAMFCWSTAFLARLAQTGAKLPLHRSKKPLKAWIDGKIATVSGWKCERFIFDLLPMGSNCGLEIERVEEFAPVKNAMGDDSPESARALLTGRAKRWLEAAGVNVDLPPGACLEISFLMGSTPQEFAKNWKQKEEKVRGSFVIE